MVVVLPLVGPDVLPFVQAAHSDEGPSSPRVRVGPVAVRVLLLQVQGRHTELILLVKAVLGLSGGELGSVVSRFHLLVLASDDADLVNVLPNAPVFRASRRRLAQHSEIDAGECRQAAEAINEGETIVGRPQEAVTVDVNAVEGVQVGLRSSLALPVVVDCPCPKQAREGFAQVAGPHQVRRWW